MRTHRWIVASISLLALIAARHARATGPWTDPPVPPPVTTSLPSLMSCVPTPDYGCGNCLCDPGEDPYNCAQDCESCGDLICQADLGENAETCPVDCGCVPAPCGGRCGLVDDGCGQTIDCGACPPPPACNDNGECDNGETHETCPEECPSPPPPPVCDWDGVCEPGEEEELACTDCPRGSTCGNGAVDPGEDCFNCSLDLALRPAFDFAPPNPRAGQAVTFWVAADQIREHPAPSWDLGNTEHRPGNPLAYSYPNAGTYTVILTATESACGTPVSARQTVTVQPAQTCDFSDLPPEMHFCCGNTHCDGGENQDTCPRDCGVPVSAGGPYQGAAGQPISFQATVRTASGDTVLSYSWAFGDGATSSQASPSHAYAAAGQYAVFLEVTTAFGATGQASATVEVSPCWDNGACESGEGPECRDCAASPLCGNGAPDPGETCTSCPRDLAGRPSFTWTPTPVRVHRPTTFYVPPDQVVEPPAVRWDMGNGDHLSGNFPAYTYTQTGTYTVTLTAKEPRCGTIQQSSQTVSVLPILTCDFSDLPPDMQICCGNTHCDAGENPSTCPEDCGSSLAVSAGGPYEGVVGEPVQFQASVTTSPGEIVIAHSWNFGDGGTSSNAAPAHTYTEPGDYAVRVEVTTTHGSGAAYAPVAVRSDVITEGDGAEIVNHTIPRYAESGQVQPVSVTMRNTGSTTWSSDGEGSPSKPRGYALAAKKGTLIPVGTRFTLPPGEVVPPGEIFTFTFTIVVPFGDFAATQLQMVHEKHGWFGKELYAPIDIENDPRGQTVITLDPTSGPPGTQVTVSLLQGRPFPSDASGRFSFGEPLGRPYSLVPVTTAWIDSTTLTFQVPAGAGCGDHFFAVRQPRTNAARFTVMSPCDPSRRNSLDVLSYNIQMLPDEACYLGTFFFGGGPHCELGSCGIGACPASFIHECALVCDCQNTCGKGRRAPLIAAHPDLQPYDVIVIQEAFSDSHRDRIKSDLFAQYPYQTDVLGDDHAFCGDLLNFACQDGGVMILSKWPIQATKEHVYDKRYCNGADDCHSDKGVLYAKVNKAGQLYHVFGTHTDSGTDAGDRTARYRQLFQMRDFVSLVASTQIDAATQPVIMAGDFNIDMRGFTLDYDLMLGVLSASHPRQVDGTATNHDGAWLDYVFYGNQFLNPAGSPVNRVRRPKHPNSPYWFEDLSDHFAVAGEFRFDLPENLSGSSSAPPTQAPLAESPTETIGDPTPTFSWSAVEGAQSYSLSVTGGADAAALLEQTSLAGTSFTASRPLPSGVDLHWEVRGANPSGPGPVSGPASFRVERGLSDPPTEAPVTKWPGGTVREQKPSFAWSPVEGASSYRFHVVTVEGETTMFFQSGLEGTSLTPSTTLPLNEDLFWMVAAENEFGLGPSSDRVHFRIEGSASNHPPTVTLVGPDSCSVPCSVELTAIGVDPEGDLLTYSWSGCNTVAPAAFLPDHGFTCIIESEGPVRATVYVTDGQHVVSATKTVNGLRSNRAPLVAISGPDSCDWPCAVTLTATATDADGDPLTFTWSGCASGSTPIAQCAVGSGGSFVATVTVSDGRGATVSASKAITGTSPPPSCQPVELRVTNAPGGSTAPSMVWNGVGYGLSWQDDRDGSLEIYFALLDAAGARISDEVRVTSAPGASITPSLVKTPAGYALAWQDERDGDPEIYFARLDANGIKQGQDLRVTSSPGYSYWPQLVWNGTGFGLAWSDGRNGNFEIYLALLDASGALGSEVRVTWTPGHSFLPSLVWSGTGYGLAWNDNTLDANFDIFVVQLDASGVRLAPKSRVVANAAASQFPLLAWSGAAYAVAWEDMSGTAGEVSIVRLQATGSSPVRAGTAVPGIGGGSLIWSPLRGSYALAWPDARGGTGTAIYVSEFDPLLGRRGPEVRMANALGESGRPVLVASDASSYALAFDDNRDRLGTPEGAGEEEIYFARVCPPVVEPGNQFPTVSLAASAASCQPTCSIAFTANASDPDGDALAYAWGGCCSGQGPSATCDVRSSGRHDCLVTVTDGAGGQASASQTVDAYTTAYETGPWSACSGPGSFTCTGSGPGRCQRPGSQGRVITETAWSLDAAAAVTPPPSTQPCTETATGYVAGYAVGDWSPCSAPCGTGFTFRTVSPNAWSPVGPDAPRPIDNSTCNTQACALSCWDHGMYDSRSDCQGAGWPVCEIRHPDDAVGGVLTCWKGFN